MYRAEERHHLTASGPALLQAVLARIKAAEEQLSTSRSASPSLLHIYLKSLYLECILTQNYLCHSLDQQK